MAEEQNEYGLPIGKGEKRRGAKLLPRYYRTEPNKKFIQATIDQLTQTGTVRRLNGYIGRQNAKAVTGKDVFLDAPTVDRKDYQLEPALVVRDELDNVTFFKDYIDYINTVDVLGGINDNHQILNKQELYSWRPHVNWDKLTNFQQYYWLPYGPSTVKIFGQQQNITSTYTVNISDEGDNRAYVFTPNGLSRNPTLRLYRGQTYRFEIDAPNEPFSIKTQRVAGTLFRYTKNVSSNAVESGVIEFTVPEDAPDVLYYVSENSVDTGGTWQVFDIEENTTINVDEEVIGKKTYVLPNGVALSNGMKISFGGNVVPAIYSKGAFYVEGVGDKIYLISELSLEVISGYSGSFEVLFDDSGFDSLPFSDATAFASQKDYITINRGSGDRNPWSRYNRWFHQDVIIKSAELAGEQPVLDQDRRATRPIIEFDANIKLYNFGTQTKVDVDLVDVYTADVFSTIEGSTGYNIDGVQLANGQRILFLADTDTLVKNRIFRVQFLNLTPPGENIKRQIHLVEETDAMPLTNETVLVRSGNDYQGKMFWFDGTSWKVTQEKTSINQAPLFDLFDEEGTSLNDPVKYQGSTFAGNKIFSYKSGIGSKDPILGFSLAYRNINNVGDIVFTFDLLQNSFSYKQFVDVITEKTDGKFLKIYKGLDYGTHVNGWVKTSLDNVQPIIRIYKDTDLTSVFPIDVYDNIDELSDLLVKVYINGKRLEKENWNIENGAIYKNVVLNRPVTPTDVVTLKCYAKQKKNANGYYDLPVNLQNNPLNNNINEFTLGEVIDHVDSIVDNYPAFAGQYPGASNLRDQGNLSTYGIKFVQHAGPLNFGAYFLTSRNANVIKAIEQAREEYGKFKRNFANVAKSKGDSLSTKQFVDEILFEINKDNPKNSPYYFSDMIGFGASTKTDYTVIDFRIKTYPLSNVFSLNQLTNKAVYVYLNDIQLVYEKDYTFNSAGFVELTTTVELADNDVITVYEYESTDGCCIPQTPSALGLWPKFEPKKYLDTTLVTPQNVIQGHDGSIILAFNDYRDDLILELEKRIFNNIKITYDSSVLDFYDILPGYNRNTDYSLDEFNRVLAPNFYQWTQLIDRDFTKPLTYAAENPFTYNYSKNSAPDGRTLPGYWRGVYTWLFDTDRIHICPWESLGYTIEPKWWQEVYGPAPYTRNNLILWQDLKEGIVREPGKPIIRYPKFARPVLENIPVDDAGNLLDPVNANIAKGYFRSQLSDDFVFGDNSPVEAAWRRSSFYPFSVLSSMILMQPNKLIGAFIDRSRVVRSDSGQLVYTPTNLRLRLQDLVVPSTIDDEERRMTAGLINYIVDYILSDNLRSLEEFKNDLKSLTNQLSHRLGGFTSKEKFNLILDSKSPIATAGVFVPQENYKIFLNTSSPTKKLLYSGVIITKILTKYGSGFEVKGYSQKTPFFYFYPWTQSGITINVGGISESFINWTAGQQYVVGNIVRFNNNFYRVKTTHVAQTNIDLSLYQKLPALPIVGGRDAVLRKEWDRTPVLLNYGHTFISIQEVVDFLQGYGEFLKDQGFVFDDYNTNLKSIASWETAVKEFLFWTTQNWSTGEEKYVDWQANKFFKADEIVIYNGDYYRSRRDHTATDLFDESIYKKIDNLNQDGASVITMSPSALGLSLKLDFNVVDDLRDEFNDYEIFKADGQKFEQNFINYTRDDNVFAFSPRVGGIGIYGAGFYLVQKEHVLIIDNTTQFNDTIYDLEAGYRQERIRVSGYKTIDWYGGFDVPGFVYDKAEIKDWQPWNDYNLGDTVRYKEFYYSANKFLSGSQDFNSDDWIRLDEKPEARLIPNWDYKADQFTDFYDLESDNFDADQQRIAQHLIGYQKRQYLENIIKNDVSEFKFYQGMIPEKGTQNVLNKLFDVLSAADQESINFDEEWAVRIGQYGGADAFEEIEFSLDEDLFKVNPQGFELVDTVDESKVDFIIRQSPGDIYVKPKNYNNNPWPVNDNFIPYLRTPGYVRYDQVSINIDSLENILDQNIEVFSEGDYVWCAFESRDWQVYRFTSAEFFARDVEYADGVLKIQCDKVPTVQVGDFIGITNSEKIQGFHKVDDVVLNSIFIRKQIAGWQSPFQDSSQVLIYKFLPQRYSSVDSEIDLPKVLKPKEIIWTDDDGSDKAAVWQNEPVYTRKKLTNASPSSNEFLGKAIAVNSTAGTLAVSDTNTIKLYQKSTSITGWTRQQSIEKPPAFAFASSYGDVLSLAPDGKWLAVGMPEASNVMTKLRGVYDNTGATTYNVGDIVKVGNTYWKAKKTVVGDGSSISLNSLDWEPAYILEFDSTGSSAGVMKQGAVALYISDSNNDYQYLTTIVSPEPGLNEHFGDKIRIVKIGSDYKMIISAPGYPSGNNQGRVYLFKYDSTTLQWQIDYDTRYRGFYNNTIRYFSGDIVFFDYKLYQAVSETIAQSPTTTEFWQRITDKKIYGYFPQPVVDSTVIDGNLIYLPLPGDDSTVIDGLGDSTSQASELVESIRSGDQYGYDFDVSEDGVYIVVSAPSADQLVYDNFKGIYRTNLTYVVDDVVLHSGAYYKCIIDFNGAVAGAFDASKWQLLSSSLEANNGKVFVYKKDEDSYDLIQTLGKTNVEFRNAERFGESVSVATDGSWLAVGSLLADDTKSDQGLVRTFKLADTFDLVQIIKNRSPEVVEGFGAKIQFINDNKSLAIFSVLGDSFVKTIFDNASTTFDRASTRVVDYNIDSGRVDVYDRFSQNFVYAESLLVDNVFGEKYGFGFAGAKNVVVVSAPNEGTNLVNIGAVYTYEKNPTKNSWSKIQEESDKVDLSKIKKAFLYNKKTNELISYLDIIDPVQGKISGVAEQEIKYKTYHDPATYSIGNDAVTVDEGMAWTDKQVGMLWWDLTRAKFLDSYTGELVYKNSTWNTLYETASIDIYEWVESKITPLEWDAQADTEAGLSSGISGKSLYGNAVYSVKKRYDTVAKTFKNTYYFWVKNKTVIPNVRDRRISASDVSALIADPKGQGIKFVEFTGTNSFSLVNVKNSLINSGVVLVVQYWLVDQDNLNVHSDWKIISKNINTTIPKTIEDKWIDSLIGVDANDRSVPDLTLPPKQRYGVQFRPRQSMFVNRLEALKLFVERINLELANLLIVDSADLSNFFDKDLEPSTVSGHYDYVIDTNQELRLVNTGAYRKPELLPIVVDGAIVAVDVVNPGAGYKYAPPVVINGVGKDAVIRTTIDEITGSIVSVSIVNKGYGYDEFNTSLTVRDLSTLIKSDVDAIGRWSIYAFDLIKNSWYRTNTQAYDVTNFWNYKDWYDVGYNQFVKIDYVVDSTYQLYTLESEIGQLVKVKNVGSFGWVLLEKFANVKSIDYTQSYKVVGRQNGTIQISNKFYQFVANNLGYDGPLYDADTFDNSGSIELRTILTALRDKILIDDLRPIYLDLFFLGLKHALSEQTFVDWAFKTSFVKAMHNVGELKQKVTYNNDNLSDFEQYINEVKPYRTKIREYVSSYNAIDESKSMVTDFDLPPITKGDKIETIFAKIQDGKVFCEDPEINEYPWKHWLDNAGFYVSEIVIIDGGTGYINRPVVNIIGDNTIQAKARAFIANGKVTKIELLTKGSGYFEAPQIEITGGLSTTGTPARAVAYIKNDLVRSNLIKIKFDRITKNYFITDLNATEVFIGTGSRLQYALKWSPDTRTGKTIVKINDQEALRDTYTISSKKTINRGYTSYSGLLTFDSAPTSGDVIEISYVKDFNYLSAADRINYYYDPQTGQLGKDLAQLMTGVDYGGVNIIGLDFKASSGWDELPWYTDTWDAFDPTFDDYIVTVADSSYEFELPYTPINGQQINVYVNGVRIDDPYFDVYDGSTVQPNGRTVAPATAKMKTLVGNGVINTFILPNLGSNPPLDINAGDQVIFRKSTSDGSKQTSNLDYDTQLSGGDMAYTTATGLAAEDIIVDGDGFVTPTTSSAPEEVVPGQVVDAVAIKVLQRTDSASANIKANNYIGDGVTNVFNMGQAPNTEQAVVVKVGNQILELGTGYTIDYDQQTVQLTTPPVDKAIVSVVSFGYNSENIIDLDVFVGDGSTFEFVTKAPWDTTVTSLVVVSGALENYELFRTDSTYDSPDKIGIRFGVAPIIGSIINYLISDSEERTYSLASRETIVADGSSKVYPLTLSVGSALPYEASLFVRNGNTVLNGPNNTYYTMENDQLIYDIPTEKFQASLYDINDFKVYRDGEQLILMVGYTLDLLNGTVTINPAVYVEGGKLVVSILTTADYVITTDSTVKLIEFTVAPTAGSEITITSMFDHDILDIETTESTILSNITIASNTLDYFRYNQIKGGVLDLGRQVLSDDYVWVVKNNNLLTHSVDYVLKSTKDAVKLTLDPQLNDSFTVITFSSNVVRQSFGFMQFKDMLNRVHYKRLNKEKETVLIQPLNYYDSVIRVQDASILTEPNRNRNIPGVIYINGERIEFFEIDGNTLGQLRRGTLGTGIPTVHPIETTLFDMGTSETIPYNDETLIDTFVYDGSTNLIPLPYLPNPTTGTIDDGSTLYTEWQRDTIPAQFGQSDELDVFVGGYNISGEWVANTSYSLGDIVIYGSYTYRCVTTHTSSESFADDRPNWKYFIGYQRLIKHPYAVHNQELHNESPEGDVDFEADFAVNGTTNAVRITQELSIGTRVVTVKRIGRVWNDPGRRLIDSNNKIANFLKEKPTMFPR